jgi:hypothetical protein
MKDNSALENQWKMGRDIPWSQACLIHKEPSLLWDANTPQNGAHTKSGTPPKGAPLSRRQADAIPYSAEHGYALLPFS